MDSIKSIDVTLLSFPTSHFISGFKLISMTHHMLIFTTSSSGVVGVGEGTPYSTTIYEDYKKVMEIANLIKGASVEDAIILLKEYALKDYAKKIINYGAYLAIETSLINILARNYKKNIGEILGDRYRKSIPVAGTIFLKHYKVMGEELKSWVHRGVKHIKFKIPYRLDELVLLLNHLKEARESVGVDLILRADANEGFQTFEKAKKALNLFAKYEIDIIEQPMPRRNLREISKLRKIFYPAIKIMLDESLITPGDIEVLAELEAADILNFHPSKFGCLTITKKAILKAQRLGFETQIGSAFMTEVGLTYYLNLAASLAKLDYPLEEIGLLNIYGYAISQNPEKFMINKEGEITVPASPPPLCKELIKNFLRGSHKNIVQHSFLNLIKKVTRFKSYLI